MVPDWSFPKVVCALCCLTVSALWTSTQTLAQGSCGRTVALLEGRTSFPGYQQGPYIFTERLAVYKPSGSGFEGTWIGTHYEQVHTYPFDLDRRAVDAIIAASPSFMPGVEAVCLSDVPNPKTIRIRCDGRFPFEVRGASVFWQGGSNPIGAVVGTELSISFQPPEVALAFELMTGQIYPATAHPGFTIGISRVAVHPDRLSSELDIRVAIEPAVSRVTDTLQVSALFGGLSPMPTWTIDEVNDVWTVKFSLSGNDSERLETAEDTDVIATARLNDCVYRKTWTLAEVLGLYGVTP